LNIFASDQIKEERQKKKFLLFVASFEQLSLQKATFDFFGASFEQHDGVTKPVSTVVVSRIKRTRSSSIILSFHWGHEEPPGVARRAAIVWLEN